ncbi:MAG: heparinase II/III family protein [Deltaproteobacteria bacterium]|nr:heparinase II/III family protein [Deltaproteobacteria bacterium]
MLLALLGAAPVRAAWQPDGIDLTRPRIVCRPAELAAVRARLEREPYRSLMRDLLSPVRQADSVALDDHSINAERIKSRAAKNLAVALLFERTVVDREVVPFTDETRSAAIARLRDLLVNMYRRSRLAVGPPLGGWDRDISTSEELQQYATAYDSLRAAGVDLGADDAVIVDNLAALAGELYENYVNPLSAGNFAVLHQNNHRSKVGAALATTALALAEYTPPDGSDPRGVREPATWLAYGTAQIDAVMRFALVSGDGAYGEGPFYLRFASQNLLPFWRAWDALTGGSAPGIAMPNFWRHPLLARGVRWALDNTLPDGTLAPTDDGNPGEHYYFGAAPLTPATAWRWTTTEPPLENDGNVSLAAESLVNFDDGLAAAPPAGSPTAFYPEGGLAALRSDWSPDAVLALVQAEHGAAAEFGRYADGTPAAPESHEHADGGSFLLHAFGERLALDPGYFSFTLHGLVNKPQDHNMILVDGSGPTDLLAASAAWLADPSAPPPTDGEASLLDTRDSDGVDVATALSRYGQPAARIERRFLFADDRYLLIADAVQSVPDQPRRFTWLLHGNGGGDSGGTFTPTATGGVWSRPGAALTAALAAADAPFSFTTRDAVHEELNRAQKTHTALEAHVEAAASRTLTLLYPSPAGDAPPITEQLAVDGAAALTLVDAAGDRRVVAWHRATPVPTSLALPGGSAAHADGVLALFDTHDDGSLRLAYGERASELVYAGRRRIGASAPGTLGVRYAAERLDVVADAPDSAFQLHAVPFVAAAADGACAFRVDGEDIATVVVGRDRRVTLRAATGNSAPAADPGPPQTVDAPPQVVRLDGRGSCDADGEALTPQWELTSAPAGSAWSLQEADTWTPALFVDRNGPFRVRLVVTDARGATSRPMEVLVLAGDRCADGVDNDRDGQFDSADADCDAGGNRPPLAGALAPLTLPVGARAVLDLGTHMTDPDGDPLVFRVAVADPVVTAAAIDSSRLLVAPRHPGRTQLFVTAADADSYAQQAVSVSVVPRAACVADCDDGGVVTVDEILSAVGIALGQAGPQRCQAADADGDQHVTVAELVRAVADLLDGCATD